MGFVGSLGCSSRVKGRREVCLRMSISSEIAGSIKEAMKARDADRLKGLRNIRAAFLNKEKEAGSDSISDEEALVVLRKLAKQRVESIELYEKGGRQDLAESEKSELALIEAYLPKLADEETTRKYVQEAIDSTKSSSPKDMGKVMGAVMKDHKSEVDGNVVRKIASELLS
uniref:GatB/YqeY domain-containing protein n=3 Tax=Rhodosorus marinus TaxID=101924 RepID=A0A7S3ABW1_9RHOD|mmetsp:Transcript_9635/g.41447  ORF Transcript_9635/g.41447 Transcript_9635/m.41447 type:complete len:171 (+) Transcript_9635:405-917(+)